jgi:hypothetical protein
MVIDSGFFGTSADNIFRIDSIASEHELESIVYTAENLDIWDPVGQDEIWKNRMSDGHKLFKVSPEVYNLVDEICDRLKDKISEFYQTEISLNGVCIARWFPGNLQDPHSDMAGYGDNEIGSIVYLNDNYVGGQTYFPQHDIELDPVAGNAFAWPGDEYYMHGVKEVVSGFRYTLPIFWKVANHE